MSKVDPQTTLNSQQSCSSSYARAHSLITDLALGQGLERKLLTKVENAWRMFSSGQKNSRKNSLQQLDTALRQLDSPATKQIAKAVRDKLVNAIKALRDCLNGAPPVPMATLTVRVFKSLMSGAAGEPAGAGVIIRVNNVELGLTGADGTATVSVPAGDIVVEARFYPSSSGKAYLTLAANETRQADIVMEDGKEVGEDTELVLDQLQDGVLDRNFNAFTLRFLKDTATVPLQGHFYVELLNPPGSRPTHLESYFSLQPDGTLLASDLIKLKSILQPRAGAIDISVEALDQDKRIHRGIIRLYLGSFRTVCKLVAPPSFPGLTVSGIPVKAAILNTKLVFNAISDASGAFEFPLLPSGSLSLDCLTIQNGKYYYGLGVVALKSSVSIAVNMLHTEDVINGVPRLKITPLTSSATSGTAVKGDSSSPSTPVMTQEIDEAVLRARRELAEKLASEHQSAPSRLASASTDEASVSVQAAEENYPVTDIATLDVPKGTSKVALNFKVQTDEYPHYVLDQSIYNDTWSVEVRADNGQRFFYMVRQINSQLSMIPIWQDDGTTGDIEEKLDVSALTKDRDASLTLTVTAMNIGDSILPTRVQAVLSIKLKVNIQMTIPEMDIDTTGDGRYYSIPRPENYNYFKRAFLLKYTMPETATIKNVKVELLAPNPWMTIVDEEPGELVEVVDEETLKVVVTMENTASTIPSQPPRFHSFKYRFKLTVEDNGEEDSDEKESVECFALWEMPDGFSRYSSRDEGGDDWCSRGAYLWLLANRNLMAAINDISGEHAKNIGHQTHQYGTDIDMMHYYVFDGVRSGGDNYALLWSYATEAILSDTPRGLIIPWVLATRQGLDRLAANPSVQEIYYIFGDKSQGSLVDPSKGALLEGWGEYLLKTGKLIYSDEEVDLGLGLWSNPKYTARRINDHNDHIHIILNRAMIDR